MPSPPTTDLPRPNSWEEFENISADVLKRIWKDPYVCRNGRQGQRQNGVDCHGMPQHLGKSTAKKYAGAQCKLTDRLTIEIIREEVAKAEEFRPTLSEYLLMTTAPKDVRLQEAVRNGNWPFDRVHVMFWDEISLELSGQDDLLQKHFPGWMARTTTEEQVLNLVLSSDPDDFKYVDSTGEFFHKADVTLRIVIDRSEASNQFFHEPWIANFPSARGIRKEVYIYHGLTRVSEVPCVSVDGGRHIIPFTRSQTDLTLTPFHYHVGRILNHPSPCYDFESALRRAGITVRE